jgi:hypothetical protein
MDKYGVRQELDSEGKRYIKNLISWTTKEHAEKIINEEMASYNRTLQHINKTIELTLFRYDEYGTHDVYTKTVKELL